MNSSPRNFGSQQAYLFPDLHPSASEPPSTKRKKAPTKPKSAAPSWPLQQPEPPRGQTEPVTAQAQPLEAWADALQAHPDYKVLRRLLPRQDWGPVPDGPTRRVIVLDTETTGLDARSERIIELAMLSVLVDANTGQPVGPVTVYESFEDPGKPITAAITQLTGIDDGMVQGQRIDDERVAQLVQEADLIVAQNAGFDRPFVEARLPGFALIDCHALLHVRAAPPQQGSNGLLHLLQGAAVPRFKLRAAGAAFSAKDALKSRGYRWDSENRVWWTSVAGQDRLQEEGQWLKTHVYQGRSACLPTETLSALVQFSARSGEPGELRL